MRWTGVVSGLGVIFLLFPLSLSVARAERQEKPAKSPLIGSGFALDVQSLWLTRSAKLIGGANVFDNTVGHITYYAKYPDSHFEFLRGYYYSVEWIDPDGRVFFNESVQQAFGNHTLITAILNIKGTAAARKLGPWKCRFYRKKEFVDEQSFYLTSPETKETSAASARAPRAGVYAEYVALAMQILDLMVKHDEEGSLTLTNRLLASSVKRLMNLPQAVEAEFNPEGFMHLSPVDCVEQYTKLYQGILTTQLAGMEDDPEQIFLAAAHGMIGGSNDPYAKLIPPAGGEFEKQGGIGIAVSDIGTPGGIGIVEFWPASPAFDAGLRLGDRIVEIDGAPVRNKSALEIMESLQGTPGRRVELKFLRGAEVLSVGVPRKSLKRPAITYDRLKSERDIHYLRILAFADDTADRVEGYLKKMEKQMKPVLILDLRGSLGGAHESTVKVADLLLSDGVILQVAGRVQEKKNVFSAGKSGTFTHFPVLVLTDESTAGTAESLAAAIRYHRRGIVLGKPTRGMGKIQEIYDGLDLGYALSLSVGSLRTPDGNPIDRAGVRPDQDIDRLRLTPEDIRWIAQLRTHDLLVNFIARGSGFDRKDVDGIVSAMGKNNLQPPDRCVEFVLAESLSVRENDSLKYRLIWDEQLKGVVRRAATTEVDVDGKIAQSEK